MRDWLRIDRLICLILFVGVMQYGPATLDSFNQGNLSLFDVDRNTLIESGPLRYAKEALLIGLSIAWPLWIGSQRFSSEIVMMLRWYPPWLLVVTLTGFVAFLLDYSPTFFVWSGLRWLMLLHVSFGVFFLSKSILNHRVSHRFIAIFFLCVGSIDLAFALNQVAEAGMQFGGTFAQARVTGFFSNAGVASFFGFALALLGMQLDRVSYRYRFAVSVVGLFVALSAGTRLMAISIFIIIALQLYEYVLANPRSFVSRFRIVIFFPSFFATAIVAYAALIAMVDRGDAIGSQLEQGGRITNFFNTMEMFYSADAGELLWGRGLGVGTNTAYGQVLAMGISPEFYRFNFLVDNGFLTTFFQLGLIGSTLFWLGILIFVISVRPKNSKQYLRRYSVTVGVFVAVLWAGNPFEHYFLMLAFAISLGCTFWGDGVSRPAALTES